MSRITKAIAEAVAKEMVAPLREKLKIFEKENIIDTFSNWYVANRIPKRVWEIHLDSKINSEFINTKREFSLKGFGFDFERIILEESLPVPTESYYYSLTFSEKESKFANDLFKSFSQKIKKEEKIKKLEADIKATLLRLGTFKKVELEFPQAVEFINKAKGETTPSEIAIPVKTILSELENLKK